MCVCVCRGECIAELTFLAEGPAAAPPLLRPSPPPAPLLIFGGVGGLAVVDGPFVSFFQALRVVVPTEGTAFSFSLGPLCCLSFSIFFCWLRGMLPCL